MNSIVADAAGHAAAQWVAFKQLHGRIPAAASSNVDIVVGCDGSRHPRSGSARFICRV
jgi:hypothetical protein